MIAVYMTKEEISNLLGLLRRSQDALKTIVEGHEFEAFNYFIQRLEYAEVNNVSVEKVDSWPWRQTPTWPVGPTAPQPYFPTVPSLPFEPYVPGTGIFID